MPETSNTYRAVPPPPAYLQKVKASFTDAHGYNVHVECNALQQSFRVRTNSGQRLFFIESNGMQKMVLRNEYGVRMGHLTGAKGNSGWVRLDEKQYQFAYFDAVGELSFYLEPGGTLVTHIYRDDAFAENNDPALQQHLVYCLVFAYAWSLHVPSPLA